MATVESSLTTPVNFAAASSGPRHSKPVGRIGPWQLVRPLHESDLARVYLARPADSPENQMANYVLKVLRNPWWRDPQAIEMQRRAAWLGRRVSHPHLLPVLSANVRQPPFYLVSPLIEGHSLAAILHASPRTDLEVSSGRERLNNQAVLGRAVKQSAPLPLSLTLWIARQVAEALTALHESTGMIHADVKPANIMVSSDGHATLIDLGFAHAPAEARHWSSRPVVGTLSYIAPESVTSSLAAGTRSDLYSLGVTLYEMIAGQLPFVADSPDELVRAHRQSKPPCIRQHVPTLPKSVASLVHRLLAKDPLRRPDSAATVAEELIRLEIASL